jgi:hypothetical protein
MNHQTTIPAHLPKIVHLCGGDQLLNVDERTITSYTEFETFSLDEAFQTADDLAQFHNDLTAELGQQAGDDLFIFLGLQNI